MRDTLSEIEGVESVEVDKSAKTATFVFENKEVDLKTVLDKLKASNGGRYKGTLIKQEKVKPKPKP